MTEWPTQTDRASDLLSAGIVAGEFAPGERVKAQDLAERWGISPTPIREALQRLVGVGLVEVVSNRGVRVAAIGAEEMSEVYGLRLLLEPFALRASLENRDPEWEAAVRASFERLRSGLEDLPGDLMAFEGVHAEFHEALLSRCRSGWVLRIIGMLTAHSARYRLLSLGPRGGPEEVIAEHERLLDACLGDDPDRAVAVLFDHIRRTVDVISGEDEGDRLVALINSAGHREHAGDLF